ncbi:MAG TPA: MBL fold metallo-hydrolase, partial [Gammaproteobacteria bacterium]
MNEPDRTLTTRRALLQGAAGLTALGFAAPLLAQPPAAAANRPPPPPGTRLIMLGTRGGPGVSVDRSESASAVVVDGVAYLVDCGYGTMRALVASGIGYQSVSTMFLTHLHDDHTADIAALLSHQWTGSKTTPTNVYGPYATERTVKGAIEFFRPNVEIRTVDEGRKEKPE